MGRTRIATRKAVRRGLWLLALALAMAGGIRRAGVAEGGERGDPAPREAPPPRPEAPGGEGAEEPEFRPGRDDPEQFYKPPPRPPRRLLRLPA